MYLLFVTDITEVTNQLQDIDLAVKPKQNISDSSTSEKLKENCKSDNISAIIDPTKKLKNLRKKLREVETLEEKIEKGLISKPEQEQITKIKRKNEILMQIHTLEKQLQ